MWFWGINFSINEKGLVFIFGKVNSFLELIIGLRYKKIHKLLKQSSKTNKKVDFLILLSSGNIYKKSIFKIWKSIFKIKNTIKKIKIFNIMTKIVKHLLDFFDPKQIMRC